MISDRVTASDHSPRVWLRAAQSAQKSSVSASEASTSIGSGGGRCDGPCVSTSGTVLPAATSKGRRRSSGSRRAARPACAAPPCRVRRSRGTCRRAAGSPRAQCGRSRSAARARCASPRVPRSPRTRRTTSELRPRGGMKSMTVAVPSAVSIVVSRISVLGAIATRSTCASGSSGFDQPPAVLGGAEQRGKTGARIEARPAQPVDRATARDERHRLTIADDRVVLEWRAHTSPIVTELLRDCHRAFELSDVDLLHAQHRFHRTLCRVGLVILQQVIE